MKILDDLFIHQLITENILSEIAHCMTLTMATTLQLTLGH